MGNGDCFAVAIPAAPAGGIGTVDVGPAICAGSPGMPKAPGAPLPTPMCGEPSGACITGMANICWPPCGRGEGIVGIVMPGQGLWSGAPQVNGHGGSCGGPTPGMVAPMKAPTWPQAAGMVCGDGGTWNPCWSMLAWGEPHGLPTRLPARLPGKDAGGMEPAGVHDARLKGDPEGPAVPGSGGTKGNPRSDSRGKYGAAAELAVPWIGLRRGVDGAERSESAPGIAGIPPRAAQPPSPKPPRPRVEVVDAAEGEPSGDWLALRSPPLPGLLGL
mmetsp:Transcript_25709/g.76722  ORF Transcript_25709/g.76722 Transcript_25709/m.76722 type:complete len:273 (-) Transcript_25709:1349-2167(-)